MIISTIEKKLDVFARNAVLSLLIIGCIALLVRLFYFPSGIPIILDGLSYFWYANDASILGHLPPGTANNGWPAFLAIFFSIFHFNNFMDYIVLQRSVSISISILTIIPVFLICKRFLGKPYAIVGAAIFGFEPRIVQNSLFGLTEPLYIFLVTTSIFFFLSENRKTVYSSFVIVALASLVRSEAIFLFLAISIMFFIRYKKERKVIAKYAIAATIFVLVLLPMVVIRIQTNGDDALTSRISSEGNNFLLYAGTERENLENPFKFLGWSMIPIFMFLVPPGAFLIVKNRDHKNVTIIIIMIIMFIPMFYALSLFSDTRYVFPLYPFFCILSILTIKFAAKRFSNQNLFLILIIGGILLSSAVFLDFKKYDYDHQREAFGIAHDVVNIAKGINDYYPEDSYIPVAEIPEKWPVLKSDISFQTSIIPTHDFNSLQKYLLFAKNKGLTHLVIDESKDRPLFLSDIFYHEEKYPYLIKVFDSWDKGYKYHLKIYKIDYMKIDTYDR